MTTHETRRPAAKSLRALAIITGGVMMLLALITDQLGLGIPGSFGRGQLLLLLAGLVVVLIGTLGRRFADLYRGTAIIVLNTLVLLACMELGAIAVVRVGRFMFEERTPMAKYAALPYYGMHDWSAAYFREMALYAGQEKRYHPYVIWRGRPFEGTTTSVDQEGLRRTPDGDCRADAYQVFAFGGSTMWGWGSPDWGTIPAYLQSGFAAAQDGPVCVVNFGQDAFVSTQSRIELLMQLQAGNTPDLAIFYDGVNEVYAAYQSGRPRVHAEFSTIAAQFEESESPLVRWLKTTRMFSLLSSLGSRRGPQQFQTNPNPGTYRTMGVDAASLAEAVVQSYIENYRIVEALAREYGFQYVFFWQPAITVGQKPLTIEEQRIQSDIDPALVDLYHAVYQNIERAVPAHPNLYYLADALDQENAQIWIDSWGHVTPVGNKLIAEAMLNIITDRLPSTDHLQSKEPFAR